MKISKLVDISQIIGVIAIIFSLIFIGIQIKQNTNATRAAVRQSLATNDIAFLNTSINSDIIANANGKIADGIQINSTEREQLIWQQFVNFIVFETVFYNYQEGFLEEELWERYKNIITGLLKDNKYSQNSWYQNNQAFTSSFRTEVLEIIANSNILIDPSKFESTSTDLLNKEK